MLNLVSLLIAAALVSLQCSVETTARHIEDKKVDLDNSLQPNAIPTPKRRVGKFVMLEPPPETIRHLPGTTTILECSVSGRPAPTVSWMKNGQIVSDLEEDSNEIIRIHPNSFGHLVSKLVVSAPSNGDVYTCVGTSGVKQKSASTTVYTIEDEDTTDILEQLFNVPMEPVITAFYDSLFYEYGHSLVLPCRVSSTSNAQVYWLDNNNKLIYDNSHTKILPSGDLFIPKTTFNDMGEYVCTVKNMYGKDSVNTFLYPMKPSDN